MVAAERSARRTVRRTACLLAADPATKSTMFVRLAIFLVAAVRLLLHAIVAMVCACTACGVVCL